MEIREGQIWERKLTGYRWWVEAVNLNDTIAIRLYTGEQDETELLPRTDFLEKFNPCIV